MPLFHLTKLIMSSNYRKIYSCNNDLHAYLLIQLQAFLINVTNKKPHSNWAQKKEFSPGELLLVITTQPDLIPNLEKINKSFLNKFLSQNENELQEFFSIQGYYNLPINFNKDGNKKHQYRADNRRDPA